ncbi:MAG: LPS export ABC transporter periplasmic protein LptC [Candidatus Adiutrix sp.]|jgi:LPS export ABC transporter protein LptC|nr:LPS export ABC transporter periplasmic protein LptC [Candidatus Adiutrix sp.]
MQRARFWSLCALGALLVVSGILLFGARYWTLSAGALKNMLPAEVDMRLDNLTLSESGDDNRSVTVNALSAQYFKTQDVFVLDEVRARISSDQGNFDIEADTGRYSQGRRVIDLSGNVKVVDGDKGVLTSETLTLKFQEGLLIGENPFCYSRPGGDLTGSSFVYDTEAKFLKVEGRAHVFF